MEQKDTQIFANNYKVFHINGCSGTSERAFEYVVESREYNTCKVALLCQESLQDLLNGLSE